jgi:two-component system response regulator NreC
MLLTNRQRPRVVVADDYTDLHASFHRLLEPSCEVVACVADGTAVLEQVLQWQPDVVVLDLFIPPTSGVEICRCIKNITPDTQVIIISATTEAEIREEARRAGASAFVSKLLAAEELVPAIQRVTSTSFDRFTTT